MRIQVKTALLFTVITACLLGIMSVSTYLLTTKFVNNDFLKRLELRAVVASKVLFEQDHISSNTYEELRKRHLEYLPQENEYVIRTDTIDRKNQWLPGSYLQAILSAGGKTVYHHQGDVDYAGILYHDDNQDYLVIKSAVNEYGISTKKKMRDVKLVSFISGVLLVYIVSLFFARKAFQPVREIIRKSKEISAYNLDMRLEESKGADEIAELTKTYNTMLDRLETAFETQNNFISNASHELRTPLTSIIGEADWALQQERAPAAYQQTILEIQQHADRLNTMVSALLTMAQSGFNGKRQEWENIDLLELLQEALESVRRLNGQNEFSVENISRDDQAELLQVWGSRNLLLLALGNIISNAVKYSRHRKVTIRIGRKGNMAAITVCDQGIGIPDKEIAHVFEPFFRASNSQEFEGFGIGLPLTKNIARIHEGSILVHSRLGQGTEVTLHLPLITSA
ncbi:HAMP domain-containing sensor histidine kinase [Flavihumibacter petaseus]|uniref:histidine kinase n=1 Tax=Flavihumibacter petaseus NBRC 106054 TaxID=1220578 RepID=A0A0E9MUB4_9BACT|nr:HAMP domain-containing sensor histidine kinase [Flavihumibacter petaseus]GAO41159.1 putative two-component histidine kinase [Flavihumibacter petaseus NBRC 106054]